MDVRLLSFGVVFSVLLNQSVSFYDSEEEVTVVPRAQEKTYSKVKSKSELGLFIDVARGLGRAVKQVRSILFDFLLKVKEPMHEVESSIRDIKYGNYKKKKPKLENIDEEEIVRNSSRKRTQSNVPYHQREMTRNELITDLVSVFREVSGIFVEVFRTLSNPVRDFKHSIRHLDYSEEYDPQEYRPRKSLKRKTTVRTIVLKPILNLRTNSTTEAKRRMLKRRRRRLLRKRTREKSTNEKHKKSDQTIAMEELLTHI